MTAVLWVISVGSYLILGAVVAGLAREYDLRRGSTLQGDATPDLAMDGFLALVWPLVVVMATLGALVVGLGKLARWRPDRDRLRCWVRGHEDPLLISNNRVRCPRCGQEGAASW